MLARNCRLFQRGVDRGELVVQVGTEAVDHSDDRERNAGCNQAVFDGGGAGLVLQETGKELGHGKSSGLCGRLEPWQPGIATRLNELLKSQRKTRRGVNRRA